jgi:hypothetical protein
MTRDVAAAGAELGAAVTTAVGTSSRGDGIDDDAAAVGKTDGAEQMDGKAEAGAGSIGRRESTQGRARRDVAKFVFLVTIRM